MNKVIIGNTTATPYPRPDWAQTDETKADYIKNKPNIPSLENMVTPDYVDSKIASLVDSAPETLDTLNELATALGTDPNFATTVTTEIGKKVDKIEGKGLSTNDFTDEQKERVDNIKDVALSGSYLDLEDTPDIDAPRQTLYLENNLRIEAREDGIYLCGIVDEESGIEDETLLYSPVDGVQAAEAGHANIADEAAEAVVAQEAWTDTSGRTLKGTLVEEQGDLENAEVYILDGYVASLGIVSTSLIATLEEGYQYVGFESALYFTTPSAIPENYTQFPADIYFKGDSTDEGAFVPEANMRYTIVFDFDGYMLNGYVSGVTTV